MICGRPTHSATCIEKKTFGKKRLRSVRDFLGVLKPNKKHISVPSSLEKQRSTMRRATERRDRWTWKSIFISRPCPSVDERFRVADGWASRKRRRLIHPILSRSSRRRRFIILIVGGVCGWPWREFPHAGQSSPIQTTSTTNTHTQCGRFERKRRTTIKEETQFSFWWD